jgi:hypothetical protein
MIPMVGKGQSAAGVHKFRCCIHLYPPYLVDGKR